MHALGEWGWPGPAFLPAGLTPAPGGPGLRHHEGTEGRMPGMDSRQCWVLGLGMLLVAACTGTPERGTRGHLELDSATNACRHRPELCARLAGEQAVIPLARTVKAVRTGHAALRVLDEATRALIETELKHCADQARTQVLEERFGGKSPTSQQCNELVQHEGRRMTRAMQLGCVMHEVALRCARKALDTLRPGGFSLEQRYRYTHDSQKLELVSNEEARSLLRQGCGDELIGTLVPDVVIHEGDPLQVQAIYDFKFPCVNSDRPPRWREYTPGHPYHPFSQGELYREALGAEVRRVVPRLGVIR